MNREEQAYVDGMSQIFKAAGMNKSASAQISEAIAELEKKAQMFNFGDSDTQGGFSWSRILVPLLAAAAAGYLGYQVRDKGSSKLSAFDNIRNYVGDLGDRFIRKVKPRPIYDISQYFDR